MSFDRTITNEPTGDAAEKSMARSVSEIGKKAFLALLVGAITFAVTNLTEVAREWVVLFSLFVASIVLLADFLYSVEGRLHAMETSLERHHQKTAKLVERRFSEIAEVTELFSLVESSSAKNEVVKQFLQRAVSLDTATPLLLKFAHTEIARVSQVLGDLAHGSATYVGEDRDWLIALTRAAQSSIDATSLPTVDSGFWHSGLGRKYLELQKEAADRGVRVRRIFVVFDQRMVEDDIFLRTCQHHADLGVDVRILRPDAVPQTLQNAIVDFILFDQTISYEADPAINSTGKPRRPAILRTRLTMAPNEAVAEHVDHFDKLWEAADAFPLRPSAPVPGARRPLPPEKSP